MSELKDHILNYLSHEDMLDYPYALQIIFEETGVSDILEGTEILISALSTLLEKKQIIIGDYIGPREIKPWPLGTPEIVNRIRDFALRGKAHPRGVDFFWIGLAGDEFKGN